LRLIFSRPLRTSWLIVGIGLKSFVNKNAPLFRWGAGDKPVVRGADYTSDPFRVKHFRESA